MGNTGLHHIVGKLFEPFELVAGNHESAHITAAAMASKTPVIYRRMLAVLVC